MVHISKSNNFVKLIPFHTALLNSSHSKLHVVKIIKNKHSGSIPRNACGRLQNIAMCDYQESVTTGQTDGQTDAGQSDPYVLLIMLCRRHNNINNTHCT